MTCSRYSWDNSVQVPHTRSVGQFFPHNVDLLVKRLNKKFNLECFRLQGPSLRLETSLVASMVSEKTGQLPHLKTREFSVCIDE